MNANKLKNVSTKTYPNPPGFFKQYTKENVQQGSCLAPPPIPSKFFVFGEEYNFYDEGIPSLESRKVQPVFPPIRDMHDIKFEMKKINRSIVMAFADLVMILERNPQSPERSDKFENIRTLFLNLHYLINKLRPIQARTTLVASQKSEIQSMERLVNDMDRFNVSTQVALIGGKVLIQEKLPDIPIPPMPNLNEEQVIEQLNLPKLDTTFENDECKYWDESNPRELQRMRYILTHWKEPEKRRVDYRYIYRDRIVALKDQEPLPADGNMRSPPPVDVIDTQDDLNALKISREPQAEVLQKHISDDDDIQFESFPRYLDRDAFKKYYLARKVAPDQDTQLLSAIKNKRLLDMIAAEYERDLNYVDISDDDDDIVKEPPRKKPKTPAQEKNAREKSVIEPPETSKNEKVAASVIDETLTEKKIEIEAESSDVYDSSDLSDTSSDEEEEAACLVSVLKIPLSVKNAVLPHPIVPKERQGLKKPSHKLKAPRKPSKSTVIQTKRIPKAPATLAPRASAKAKPRHSEEDMEIDAVGDTDTRPESLQELNMPASVASGSDDEQPPVLERF